MACTAKVTKSTKLRDSKISIVEPFVLFVVKIFFVEWGTTPRR